MLPAQCLSHSLAFLVLCHLLIHHLHLEDTGSTYSSPASGSATGDVCLCVFSVAPAPFSRPGQLQICCIPCPLSSWVSTKLFIQQPWEDRIKAGLCLWASMYISSHYVGQKNTQPKIGAVWWRLPSHFIFHYFPKGTVQSCAVPGNKSEYFGPPGLQGNHLINLSYHVDKLSSDFSSSCLNTSLIKSISLLTCYSFYSVPH